MSVTAGAGTPPTPSSRFKVAAELVGGYLTTLVVEIGVVVGANLPHRADLELWVLGTEAASLGLPLLWLRKYGLGLRSAGAWPSWIVPGIFFVIAARYAASITTAIAGNFWHNADTLFLAPAGEEILFRGALWGGLGLIAPLPVQLIVTSAAFMLLHISLDWHFFATGLLFGLIRCGGSVWPCIATHSLVNILILLRDL